MSTTVDNDSLKRQPGAIISHAGTMYEVTGADGGKLLVVNCRREHEPDGGVTWLRGFEVVQAQLVRRAPPIVEDKPATRTDDPRSTPANYGLASQAHKYQKPR